MRRRSIEPHLLELAVVRQPEPASLPPVIQIRAALLVLLLLMSPSIIAPVVLIATTIVEYFVRACCRYIGRLVQTDIKRIDFILLWMGALLDRVLHQLLQGFVSVYFLLLQVMQRRILQNRRVVPCIVARHLLSLQMVKESPRRYLHAPSSHIDRVCTLRSVFGLSIILSLLCALFV